MRCRAGKVCSGGDNGSSVPALRKLMEDPAKRAGVPLCMLAAGRGTLHRSFGQAELENGEKSL